MIKDLSILTSLTHVLHKFSDVEEIYRVALDSVMELEVVDMTAIYLVDEEKREAVLQAYRNLTEDYIRRANQIPYPKGVTWKLINSGSLFNIEDIQKDPDIGPAGTDMGPHGSLGIPIFLEEKVIGVIWFASYKKRKFNKGEVTLLSTIGDQIAIAISKAKREETLRASLAQLSKKNRYETIISTVTRSVHRSINLDEVLENAVDAMSRNIDGADNVVIYLVEGEEAVMRANRGYPDWYIQQVKRISYPKGATWKTIIEDKPRYVTNVDQENVIGPAGREVGTKSYASMPIHFEGKTIGCMNIHSTKRNTFNEEELKLLEILAQQIETAINNAQQAEALRKARDELEMRVRERTAELTEANKALQIEISERKEAEEELRESEGRLRAILDGSPTVIYIKDTEGRYITANRQFEALFHVERERLKGRTEYDIFPKNLADAFRANDQKVIMAKAPLEFEEVALHDGGLHTYISIKFPLYDSAGTLYAICGISTDITKRKRAEKELSAAKKRLSFLADASSLLSGSLDYETTLKNVARLAVPEISDWCAVDIIDQGGSLKRLAVAHIDPAKVDLAYKVESRYPTSMDAPYGMLNVLRTSKPELYPEIPDSALVEVARDAEHLQILRDLGLKSAISVPLLTRGQMLGMITLVIAESGRRYNSDDLALAEHLARRAASAIDNARLYRSAQSIEERFSSFMQNLPAAAWIKDIEGCYIYANRIGEEIFHRKLSDLIGKMDDEIFSADTAKRFKENDKLVITRGESLQTIETLPQEDGIHHSIVSKFPISDHTGALVMIGGVAIDITEHMKAEEGLRESEERYRTFVEHTYDLIIEVTIDGRFLYVNPNYKNVLGYEPAELIGRSIFEHIHPDDRPAAMAEFMRAVESFSSGHAVHRYRHKDGQWLWLESTGKAFKAASGEIRGVIASRDITERKRMEEELLKAQKLESIGVLAGGIAHDFNNLLAAILGNISLTKMYASPEDNIYKRLTEAEKACLRAKGLAQQLLTFSKGGAPIKKVAFIRGLIKDSASFALIGSNVRCEFSIAEDLWIVEVDEGQISQVINNMIINAAQAMPEGGVIRVMAENVNVGLGDGLPLKEGKYVKITMEDEGIGIPQEHLSKIFNPYFTTKQKGSGLGLATAYSIIRSHNGYIGVESKLRAGTKFYIYLPASEQEIPAKWDIKETPIIGKGRILVMDDDDAVREVTGAVLSRIGYEVELARDGEEAIELYREARGRSKPFNAIIMDLTIRGGMGGREAIKRLLEIDPEIKAIVSSGYSNDPVISEYRKYGFSGVVVKPYKIQELSDVVNRIIRGTAQEPV